MSEIVDCISWVVQKTCWTFYVFCEFLFLRFLDLLGLLFNILACLTIIRLPCMIKQFAIMKSMSDWRLIGFIQCLIFIMDIPIILMAFGALIISFGLVYFPMKREIEEKRIKCDYTYKNDSNIYFGGFKLRKLVVRYFFKHLTGMLCIPLLLLTLLSWRSVILARKLRSHNYFKWKWRKVILVQFLQLFVDIPCVFVAFFVVISWRLPFYIRDVNKVREDHSWSTWRFVAFAHFALLFVDLFCFLLFILTVITWRLPLLIKELRGDSCTSQWDVRTIVVKQFLLIFVDIPCIFCFFLVLITVWRLPRFIKNLKKDEWEIRSNCVYQALMMMVDFVCFLIFGMVLLTLWRLYPLIRDIRKYKKQGFVSNPPDTAETSHHEPESDVVSRRSSWKIRKAICKHFIFLLIDIPAILLSTLVLVTIFRLPSFLAKLIQSGDFYSEFAMIAFMEVAKLLIDIVFLFFFIFLMILRPFASWVHLLEDEEHMQYRHIRFHMKGISHMVKEIRENLQIALEEEFSLCLKDRVDVIQARTRLSQICEFYLKPWELLHVKVLENDAYPDLAHLIATVIWYERRRPYKVIRRYACELSYLEKPVPSVHDENIASHQQEMIEYEEKLIALYNLLREYSPPKVPLWQTKCGLFTRSRRETQKVLLGLPGGNIVNFILILINLIFVYRGPRLLIDLYHRWYDRRSIILRSLKEYLLDAVTFLRILIVLIFVYRAPALILDITIDIFQKHSWTAVRVTAKRYPLMIIDDITGIITTIFGWRTVRFLFTAVLFGILIPADVLLTVFKLSFDKCTAYLLSAFLFLVYMGFPFAFAFYFGEQLLNDGFGIIISYIIGGYGLSFVVVLVLLILILLKNRGTKFSVAPEPYDYVRLNWENVHVVVFEIVEVLQLIALVFSLNELPMAGSEVLNEFSNYLLFNFASFEVKLSLTVAGFLVWFVVCGAPIIFENILEEFNEGECASNPGWRLLMSLFSNTLFLSIVEGLCGLAACDYSDNVCNNNGTITNSTCYTSSLLDDPNTMCWVGKHRGFALFGLWGLFWYTTTAIIYGTEYGEVDSANVDIKFSPVYNTVMNFLKAVMIGAVVLISANHYTTLGILLVLSLVAVLFTIFFKRLVGFVFCNSVVVSYFRVASFVILGFSVASALVAKRLDDRDSYIPLAVFLVSSFGTLLVACIASIFRKKQTATEKLRKQFRAYILTLEKRLTKEDLMSASWKDKRMQWRRLVRNVYQAQRYDRNVAPEVWERLGQSETTDDYTAPPAPPPDFAVHLSSNTPTSETTKDYTAPPNIPPPKFVTQHPGSSPAHPKDLSLPDSTVGEISSNAEVNSAGIQIQLEDTEGVTTANAALPSTEIISVMPEHYTGKYDLNDFLESRVRNLSRLQNRGDDAEESEAATIRHLQCNGKNILLFLERFIRFSAFSFSFVSQIPFWRQAVSGSNWTGLFHCVQILDKALTGEFNKPTELDISLGNPNMLPGVLGPDPDNEMPPSFTPEPRDPESIKGISDAERERALRDVQRLCPEEPTWLAVFEKVLPTIPIIRKWSLPENSNNFELILRRPCQATVVDVGPKGVKLAKGAVIVLPKRLKGVLFDNLLTFEKRCEPVGKKGPVSVAVSEIKILNVGEKIYLSSNGKKINVEKAIDSLKSLKWN
ncbi:uncharacterized protein LOC114541091 [Dendronephthya gigantea]|uniref:uncharacterized protein LOC114541091 n=1 Tax=Dendronephthya gigantea TaxID=151771 RepID=UPI0010695580|nr:uncharacterized protein LOC114541091 [Dendronephthya gigantea]